jgi:hypothetical protein
MVYLDYNTLQNVANDNGLTCELIQGEHYDYLAKLKIQTIKHIMESKLEKIKIPIGNSTLPKPTHKTISRNV